MRGIKPVLIAIGAILALSVFGVSSASAVVFPLFVSKSGTYPQSGTISGTNPTFDTTSGHAITCPTVLGTWVENLHLFLELRLYHDCSTTILFSKPACTSPGEPSGLIHEHLHYWLGYLTDAAGELMVGVLREPDLEDELFECNANSLEHIHVLVLGDAIGAIPAGELNKRQKSFKIDFEQSGGKQSVQTFLLPLPLSLMTGVHMTLDITGSISETTEAAEESLTTYTLSGTEEGEIQA